MGKKILAIVAGYFTMAVSVFVSFTFLYLLLGPEGSFAENSYRVSITWVLLSIVISIAAAILGGYVCQWISKNRNTSLLLAVIVLLLGIILAIPPLTTTNEYAHQPRTEEVENLEAMQRAQQPPFILILNPIIGAVGVFFGSRLKGEKKA